MDNESDNQGGREFGSNAAKAKLKKLLLWASPLLAVLFLWCVFLALRVDWIEQADISDFSLETGYEFIRVDELPKGSHYFQCVKVLDELDAFYEANVEKEDGKPYIKAIEDFLGFDGPPVRDNVTINRMMEWKDNRPEFMLQFEKLPAHDFFSWPMADYVIEESETVFGQMGGLMLFIDVDMWVHAKLGEWNTVSNNYARMMTSIAGLDRAGYQEYLVQVSDMTLIYESLMEVECKFGMPFEEIQNIRKTHQFIVENAVPFEHVMKTSLKYQLELVDYAYGDLDALHASDGDFWFLNLGIGAPGVQATSDNLKRLYKEIMTLVAKKDPASLDSHYDEIEARIPWKEDVGYLFVKDAIGAKLAELLYYSISIETIESHEFKKIAIPVWLSIKHYQRSEGVLLKSLDDLTPKYFKTVPKQLNGNDLFYTIHESGEWYLSAKPLTEKAVSDVADQEYSLSILRENFTPRGVEKVENEE